MLQDDVVSCVIAMPPNLFRSVAIPVCVWFFAKDKGIGTKGNIDRQGEVLFIDARERRASASVGGAHLQPGRHRHHCHTHRTWRAAGHSAHGEYEDVPWLLQVRHTARDRDAGWGVTPGRYVGMPEAPEDDEPIDDKIARLTDALTEHEPVLPP